MIALIVAFTVAGVQRDLEVYAAASLRESFQSLAATYEVRHPGTSVKLTFAGSQQLAAQIRQGAPADVFASASPKNLDQVEYEKETRKVFALNQLVLVTPRKGMKLRSLGDLTKAQKIVLAAPAVPVGGYSRQMMKLASVKLGDAWLQQVNDHVVSEEQDVRAVLTKVELGEADAGIVYSSDAIAAKGKVQSTPIPKEFQPKITYPVAVLKNSKNLAAAKEFVKLLLSAEGRRALKAQGFTPPS